MIKLSRWQLLAVISIKIPLIDGNFVRVDEFLTNASSIPSSCVFSKASSSSIPSSCVFLKASSSSISSSVKSAEFGEFEFDSASLVLIEVCGSGLGLSNEDALTGISRGK